MDVPGEHFGMSSLPRATQRDVATLAIRHGATCHSLQRREAEAGVATNRTSVSRHVTLRGVISKHTLLLASSAIAAFQLHSVPVS
jgi:hypothetical protein